MNKIIAPIDPLLMKPAPVTGVLQTAIGYLGANVINTLNLYLHPGKVILGAPPVLVINPLQAGVCSLVFAIVDRVAMDILKSKHSDLAERQLLRMVVTLPMSALLSSVCLGITFNAAALAIVTSVVGLTILLSTAQAYSRLAYS